jgi:CAAX protease family protein
MQKIISTDLFTLLFFFSLSIIANAVAYYKGFYSYCFPAKQPGPNLRFSQVLVVFAIYLVTMLLIPLFLFMIFRNHTHHFFLESNHDIKLRGFVYFLSTFCSLFFIFLYAYSQNRKEMKKMWKDPMTPHARSIGYDMMIGASAWLISFPLVNAAASLIDLLLYLFLKVEHYEQNVVTLLKSISGAPLVFASLIIVVLIFAPFIEELLFRGFLQNWLKRVIGFKKALIITSLCFALFHYSSQQGAGNLSLIPCFFILALFLGFIYERQRSLIAPITLHALFNFISIIRIFFIVTKG